MSVGEGSFLFQPADWQLCISDQSSARFAFFIHAQKDIDSRFHPSSTLQLLLGRLRWQVGFAHGSSSEDSGL